MRDIGYTLGKGRRMLLVLLALLLALSGVLGALASIAKPDQLDAPRVAIVAVGVSDGKYLELGLSINSTGENNTGTTRFQSLGAVLEYDPELLTPVYWDEAVDKDGAKSPEAIPLDPIPVEDEEEAAAWYGATALPTKGPDELSGKTALAYIDEDTEKGYLYLSAEAPKLTKFDQTDTEHYPELEASDIVVTERTEPEEDEVWQIPAEDAIPVTNPIDQVVTVRFLLTVEEPEEGETIEEKIAAAQKAAVESIRLTTDTDIAEGSPVGDEEAVIWLPSENGIDIPVAVDYIFIADGVTVYSGGGGGDGGPVKPDMDGILSVTFWDWDETLLGVLAVPAEMDISELVNDYVRQWIHPELNDVIDDGETITEADIPDLMESKDRNDTYRGMYPSTYGDDSTIDLTGEKYPLTNKLEYVFYKDDDDEYYFDDGWVPVTAATLDGSKTGGVFTAYTSDAEAEAAGPVDFTAGITESIMVKAAYVAGPMINYVDGVSTNVLYSIDPDVDFMGLNQTAADTGDFMISFKYYRINAAKYGVTRPRDPAIRMTITVEGSAFAAMQRINVENKDTIDVTLTVAKRVSSVQYMLRELFNANVATGSQISGDTELGAFFNLTGGVMGSPGFVFDGTLAKIIKEAVASRGGETNTYTQCNVQVFNDANLKNTNGAAFTTTTVVTVGRARITTLLGNLGSDSPYDLTYYQVQYAILNAGAYVPASTAETFCKANYSWVHGYGT